MLKPDLPMLTIFGDLLLLFSCSVMSSSLPPPATPTRLLCPWDFPGKNPGVGCHFLLQGSSQPRDQTTYLTSSAFVAGSLPLVPPGKPYKYDEISQLYLQVCPGQGSLFSLSPSFTPKPFPIHKPLWNHPKREIRLKHQTPFWSREYFCSKTHYMFYCLKEGKESKD